MRLRVLLWIIVFVVLPVSTMAQENKEIILHDLYNKSGLEKQIAQMPIFIKDGFDQTVATDDHLKAIPRSVLKEFRASIETVFAPENIRRIILSECEERMSAEDLKKAIEWFDSTTGRKFTQLEEIASTPEKYNEMQHFALKLQASPPLPETLKRIQQLAAAVKATETSVEVAMNAQIGIAIAILESIPKEQQPTYEKLVAEIEQTRPQMERAMRRQTIVSFLFTYRDVTHDELDRYIAFASSPTGINFHNSVISGLKKALLEGSYKWGKIIDAILKQSKGRTEA